MTVYVDTLRVSDLSKGKERILSRMVGTDEDDLHGMMLNLGLRASLPLRAEEGGYAYYWVSSGKAKSAINYGAYRISHLLVPIAEYDPATGMFDPSIVKLHALWAVLSRIFLTHDLSNNFLNERLGPNYEDLTLLQYIEKYPRSVPDVRRAIWAARGTLQAMYQVNAQDKQER